MAEPPGSDLVELLIVEDADGVRRPEETVPHQHIRKILETLLPLQPALEGVLENMGSDLDSRRQFLEGPVAELVYCPLQKLYEEVEEGQLPVACVLQFGGVGLEDHLDVCPPHLSAREQLAVNFLSEGVGTSVNFLSPKNASDNFLVISYIISIFSMIQTEGS